jgi:ribosomal protein S27E
MATKAKKVEPKHLKLVCKCGDCTHWEIVLVRHGADDYAEEEYIKCVSCGDTFTCNFSVGPHEGLHYEKV